MSTKSRSLQKYPYGDGGEVIISKFDPSIVLYNENNNGKLRRSIDGGTSYGIISIPGFWGTAGADWLGAMIEHPTTQGTFYHAKRNGDADKINFWKSTDFGATWGGISPFGSVDALCAPQTIAISTKEPQKIYMSSSGFFGDFPFPFGRGLYKSTDDGEHWDVLITEDDEQIIPFKYITRVITAPSENSANPDEVYLTLSGFENINEGHVFKSTNEGANWININGNLPNTPANDIVWWQSGCGNSSKTIAVATDVGVFSSTNEGDTWKLIAEGLPIVPLLDLEYVPFKNSIRAATFGRGVWEVELDGDIYIKDNVYFPIEAIVDKNIVVCSGGVLNFTGGGIVRFAQDKQITVLYGGKITGSSTAIFYGNGAAWKGIVVEPGGEADLDNCFFDHTSTPITLNGDLFVSSPQVSISNCTFYKNVAGVGTINLNNRDNVIIENCNWDYPNNANIQRVAINSINSNDLLINNNHFNQSTLEDVNFGAISIDYGNNITISNNDIFKIAKGITILNCSPFIYRNDIICPLSPSSFQSCGITMSNSYSSNLKQNYIKNYGTGIKLLNSSPLMFENVFLNNLEEATALVCETNSSPRLKPQESNGQTIWDAGKNEFEALYTDENVNYGFGLNVANYSFPDLDFGCNTITTSTYSITGNIAYCIGAVEHYLVARRNIWSFTENVCDAYYDDSYPYCENGSGGSGKEKDPPPQPIIVNYGNGIYDTIQLTTRNVQVNSDQALYLSANNDEITGNYQSAITKYEQVIQNYQDSLTAINSLRKLLHCKDKMNADTTAYSQLRGYYQAKILSNLADTVFVNVAEELAAKCLVRMGHPTNAIDEYEVIISNTNDSAKILCAELNIIETYLIIQNSGDSPNYTGQLGYLKPMGKEDAYKKIMDRLHKGKNKKPVNQMPKEYQLSQNYPNPFNPVTKIKYALPYASNVTLKVYDILGREVISLVNEFKDAGSYIIEFNGKNYASGVYFYRIEAEGQNGRKYVERKKMVLVK
ncbi:MAG TPA: T9SS type A sorting domain-containing protein [Ignavibacteria bacterium]|nr:T9SS type A sorting domain-containing protein [Ignavibacteria bacterium]HMR00504.1 T9SS type A sorting domain-containing protein [Ignavibacteria bacterium]